MATLLPEAPSFGTAFARALGSGLGQGIPQGFENARKQKLLSSLLGSGDRGGSSQRLLGQNQQQEDPFARAKAAALSGEHDLSRILSDEAKMQGKQEFAREHQAEPKLLELEDKLNKYEQEGLRFDRLQQLFSPELEKKFPSSFTAALFTKNGELRPTATASLSPEAQEAVKLVADNLSGAKDTFGARVTNFDIQSYMKRLPTLLNSAEGRRRVLRDLSMMNELNQMHTEGVLGVIDRYGGPGKISVSKAERIFKKEFAPQMKKIKEEFVNPEKATFNELPPAQRYVGRKFKNEETGEVLVSNGKEWLPE